MYMCLFSLPFPTILLSVKKLNKTQHEDSAIEEELHLLYSAFADLDGSFVS
jgi:hypothetical protein